MDGCLALMADTFKICYRGPVSGNSMQRTLQILTRLYKGNEKKAGHVIANPGAVLKTFSNREQADKFIARLLELGISCYIEAPDLQYAEAGGEQVEGGFDFVSSITCPHCGAQQESTRNCRECGLPVNAAKKTPVRKNTHPAKKHRQSAGDGQAEKFSWITRSSLLLLVSAVLAYLGFYFTAESPSEVDSSTYNEAAEISTSSLQKSKTGSSVTGYEKSNQFAGMLGQGMPADMPVSATGDPALNLSALVSGVSEVVPQAINLPFINSSDNLNGSIPDLADTNKPRNIIDGSIDILSTSTTFTAKGEHMSPVQPVFSADKVDIPGHLMQQVQELDPLTDSDWEKKVASILKELGPDERKFVYSQHLEPKGIRYQSAQRRFTFDPGDSVQDAIRETSNAELRHIGNKLLKLIESMTQSKSATQFADQMEGAVDLINSFDARDDLSIQKEKSRLRKALLSELVSVTRKAQFEVERNPRALSVAAVQNFIIEVYIKHQLLGYRFRTLPIGTLEQDSRPFVRDVIAKQARLRQCDIIKTGTLLYLIAPVKDAHQNPFSVRRFLSEESLLGGSFVYFNGVIINLNKRLEEERYRNGVTRILDRIVTLERQLSDNIVNLVHRFDEYHEQTLKPMVTRSLEADGSAIGLSIDSRMEDFELQLEKEILTRVDHAIVNIASTNDDYEFLFFSLRRILIEMAAEVRDFASDSAAWTQRVEITEMKIIALLHLLDKRKAEIFTSVRSEEIDPEKDPSLLLKELHFSLKKYGAEISQLNLQLRESLDHQETMNRTGFTAWLQKTFSFSRKAVEQPEEIRKKIQSARKKCFLALIRTLKQYPKILIYMEFEEVTPVIDGIRHYAIAQGVSGVSELPMMLRLQEDANAFDIGAITKILTPRPKTSS